VADDFQIKGAEQFLRLSKALKQAGEKELRKELNKNLKDATKPLIKETQAAFADAVPSPLRSRASNTKQTVQVRTGRDAGVGIAVKYGKAGRGMGASNARLANQRGQIRHPVFGNRGVWANTPVPSAQGWFDNTLQRGAPTVRPFIEDALDAVARKVVDQARRR
jgi:hypothetical protein